MRRSVPLLLAFAVVLLALPALSAAASPAPIKIRTLSDRADLISDGNALVGVTLPTGVNAGDLKVTVGGRDVSAAFTHRVDGMTEGLVQGLALGRDDLVATAPGARGARLTITDHPNGGPVFSGPQIQPWFCQKGAVDAQCDQPPVFTYLYKSTDPTKPDLQPYDPQNPPSDVATTTTDEGITVPFSVRQDLGYQARDEYKILTLLKPGEQWNRWAAPEPWYQKRAATGGG